MLTQNRAREDLLELFAQLRECTTLISRVIKRDGLNLSDNDQTRRVLLSLLEGRKAIESMIKDLIGTGVLNPSQVTCLYFLEFVIYDCVYRDPYEQVEWYYLVDTYQ